MCSSLSSSQLHIFFTSSNGACYCIWNLHSKKEVIPNPVHVGMRKPVKWDQMTTGHHDILHDPSNVMSFVHRIQSPPLEAPLVALTTHGPRPWSWQSWPCIALYLVRWTWSLKRIGKLLYYRNTKQVTLLMLIVCERPIVKLGHWPHYYESQRTVLHNVYILESRK